MYRPKLGRSKVRSSGFCDSVWCMRMSLVSGVSTRLCMVMRIGSFSIRAADSFIVAPACCLRVPCSPDKGWRMYDSFECSAGLMTRYGPLAFICSFAGFPVLALDWTCFLTITRSPGWNILLFLDLFLSSRWYCLLSSVSSLKISFCLVHSGNLVSMCSRASVASGILISLVASRMLGREQDVLCCVESGFWGRVCSCMYSRLLSGLLK